MNIGVVGQGYVGSAIKFGFENFFTIHTYDKYDTSKSTVQSIEGLVSISDLIFVCVPTPMNSKTGECHTDIVKSVCKEILNYSKSKILIIKSTVPPGTTLKLNNSLKTENILFNPEFLTEANFIEDFKNQNRIIIGGSPDKCKILENLYKQVFKEAQIINTDSTSAEMVKYMTNAYLATKVSFANEIKLICDSLSIDYDDVVKITTLDNRIGNTHLTVPGPDGELGFGGHCLPKDLNALIYLAEQNNLNINILKAALATNDTLRKNRDWEAMSGRAIIDE